MDNDDYMRGWLTCLVYFSVQLGASCPWVKERFQEIGSPSAATVRRLGLTDFDRRYINAVRKAL